MYYDAYWQYIYMKDECGWKFLRTENIVLEVNLGTPLNNYSHITRITAPTPFMVSPYKSWHQSASVVCV